MTGTDQNYREYGFEDFVSDDRFINWAQGKSDDASFWENYIANNPAQRHIIIEAKGLVAALRFEKPAIADDFFEKLSKRIDLSIEESDTVQTATAKENEAVETPLKSTNDFRIYYRIAAGIAAALLIALAFIFYPRTVTVENGYAGIKEIVLPDSSVVILNANSKLSYADHWDNTNRTVELSGEGFFKINHLTQSGKVMPFVVKAGDLKLHVLGTSFNVISTSKLMQVTLRTGRLKVTNGKDSVFMKPADQLSYDGLKKSFSVLQLHDENYMDWTNMEFVFNDLSIDLVTQKLANYYNISFHFEDEKIKKELLSGRLGLSDREETLHTLELLLNKKMVITDKEVTISR